ncbi:hypothetical protein M427DRAFT_149746 [Gonapodya prolifera JEL478]|uniref:TmcB/TmcC TPR repeats domain-containing protein n=1 Tax=Gonapodya prolifera (strain JEL478) TaxID=1344416 RepID=A0A138ZYX4_GONPJ|nr:hypothetical protein M427DRAFT_149746 [Gonapodya prolifera JEL478]|eukprot:KXS09475.1 hypothetical protein M427DRAFT_149746 [Gonapodya prolifera JEL478]
MDVRATKTRRNHRSNPIESLLFPTLYALGRQNHLPQALEAAFFLFEDLQLCSFSWRSEYVPGLPNYIQYVFNPIILSIDTTSSFEAAFWTVVGLLVITIGLLFYVFFSFSRGEFKHVWPLKVIRILSAVFLTFLFIPSLEILLAAWKCPHATSAKGPQCLLDTRELPYVIMSLILTPSLFAFVLFMSLFLVDTNPQSTNLSARIHGQFDALYAIIKTAVVIADKFGGQWGRLGVVLLACFGSLVYLAKTVPFFHPRVNALRAGAITFGFCSAVIACLTKLIADPDQIATPSIVFLALSGPASFLLGGSLVYRRLYTVRMDVITRLKQKRAVQGALEVPAMPLESDNLSVDQAQKQRPSLNHVRVLFIDSGETKVKQDHNENDAFDSPKILENAQVIASRKEKRKEPVFGSELEVEIACRFVRDSCREDSIALLKLIFEEAHQNISLKFAISTRRKKIQNGKRPTWVRYAGVEGRAKRLHAEALISLRRFWVNLNTPKPDMRLLSRVLEQFHSNAERASTSYSRLLDRFPNSKQLLRLYAAFLQGVRADFSGALKLIKKAEDLEVMEMRRPSMRTDFGDAIGKRQSVSLPTHVITEEASAALIPTLQDLESSNEVGANENSDDPTLKNIKWRKSMCDSRPVRRLDIQLKLAVLASLGVLIFSFVLATSTFGDVSWEYGVNRAFRRSRSTVTEAIQESRLLTLALAANNTVAFTKRQATLMGLQTSLQSTILPALLQLDDHNRDTKYVVLKLATADRNQTPTLVFHTVSIYELVLMCYDAMGSITSRSFSDFMTRPNNNGLSDPDVNFFLQNAWQISSVQKTLWTVLGVQLAAQACIAVALYILVISKIETKTHSVIKLLVNLPKATKRAIVNNLDEAIEAVTLGDGDDETEMEESGTGDPLKPSVDPNTAPSDRLEAAKANQTPRYLLFFVLGCTLLALACLSMFVAPILELSHLAGLSRTMDNVGAQRFHLQRILMIAGEVAVQDMTLWNAGETEMYMQRAIDVAKTRASFLRQGDDVTPGSNDFPDLAQLLVTGGTCHHESLLPTGCDNRTYVNSIGLTPSLVYSGVETLPPSSRTVGSDQYRLMNEIIKDLIAGTYVLSSGSAEMTAVFAIGTLVILLSWFFLFRRIVADLNGMASELVDIVFSVPKSAVQPGSALAACIATGGLSLGVEEYSSG